MKIFSISIGALIVFFLSLALWSCKTASQSIKAVEVADTFILEDILVSTYENNYNNKNKLISYNVYQAHNDTISKGDLKSQAFCFYDNRDKLIKEELYELNLDSNEASLASISLYSDLLDQYIKFSHYPNDIATYECSNKNKKGLVVEKYIKQLHDSTKTEVSSINKYDKKGRVVSRILNNLLDNTSETIVYRYTHKKDTLITNRDAGNDGSWSMSKTFKKKDLVTILFTMPGQVSPDIIYKSKNHTLFIYHFFDTMVVMETFLDSFGNPLKIVSKMYLSRDESHILQFE